MGLDKNLKNLFDSKKDELKKSIDSMKEKVDSEVQKSKDKVDDLKDSVSLNNIKDKVEDKIDDIKDDAKDKLKGIENKVKSEVDRVSDNTKDKINDIKRDAISKVAGSVIASNTGKIAAAIASVFTSDKFVSFVKKIPFKLYQVLWNIPTNLKDDIKRMGDHIQFITPIIVILYCAVS